MDLSEIHPSTEPMSVRVEVGEHSSKPDDAQYELF